MKATATQTNNQRFVAAVIELLSNGATPADLRNNLADSLSDILNETQIFDLTPANLRDWLPRALATLERSKPRRSRPQPKRTT